MDAVSVASTFFMYVSNKNPRHFDGNFTLAENQIVGVKFPCEDEANYMKGIIASLVLREEVNAKCQVDVYGNMSRN